MAKRPEFFKVYFPDFSQQHLRIPPAFVKEFRGNIPNEVILRDVRGKHCHVGLERVERDVLIKNGWQEFVRDHSLTLGDFLVFSYNGSALFDVSIFGRSGCRKDESSGMNETTIRVKKEEGEEEIEDELTNPPQGTKRMQREFGLDRAENSGSLQVTRGKSQRISTMNSPERTMSKAASFVKPKNPHFISVMSRSSHHSVHIPRTVLRRNNIKLPREMVIRDQKKKSWPVRVSCRSDGRFAFVGGWAKFWKEHHFGPQDQCVFEFINVGRDRIAKEIRVHVIRATQMSRNPCRR